MYWARILAEVVKGQHGHTSSGAELNWTWGILNSKMLLGK